MIRWGIVILTLLLAIVAMIGIRPAESSRTATDVPLDEVLAYDLSEVPTLRLKVRPGIEHVWITTWCLVGPWVSTESRFAYGIRVTPVSPDGTKDDTQRFAIESRVSHRVSTHSPAPESYTAHLPDSDDLVTDARTVRTDTRVLVHTGGSLEISTEPGMLDRILVRATFREARGELERRAHEESLGSQEQNLLVANRTSLGYLDVPNAARSEALSTWGRRLDAEGRFGEDYALRRLLIGFLRQTTPLPTGAGEGFLLRSRQAAALNFTGPVTLRIHLPPRRTLLVTEGTGGEVNEIDSRVSGVVKLPLNQKKPRSVVIENPHHDDVRLRFRVPERDARAQVGVRGFLVPGAPDIEILPDVRRFRYARLTKDQPVVVQIAPGQRVLGVTIRADVAEDDEVDGAVEARWRFAGAASKAVLPVQLVRSRFDRWLGGSATTEAESAMLSIPKGVREISFHSASVMYASFWAIDPEVEEDVLEIPYRLVLSDDERWRNAPFDVRSRATIRPGNWDQLERDGRILQLAAQVRIERRAEEETSKPLPERAVRPKGAPSQRRLLEPSMIWKGGSFPQDAWTPLDKEREVTVAAKGSRAGRLLVSYFGDVASLGKNVELVVDGAPIASQVAMTTAGTLEARVKPGARRVEVTGLGTGGRVFVKAPPSRGGRILRRRVVFELGREKDLVFSFTQPKHTALRLILFVGAPRQGAPWQIRYAIDDGAPRRQAGGFVQRLTIPEGVLWANEDELGEGWFWGLEDAKNPVGLAKVSIPMGDDLVPGKRTVRLRLPRGPSQVWLRAVLVGQKAIERATSPRLWVEENR